VPRYEYACPDGHRFERVAPMRDSAKRRRCPVCARWAHRRPSIAPAIVTDANNPLREVGRDWGLPYDTTTRAGVKAMQADGVDMVTPRDRDLAQRRQGKAAIEGVREALRRVNQPIQINTKAKEAQRAHRTTGGDRTRARRSA